MLLLLQLQKNLPESPPNLDAPEYLDIPDSQDPYEDFDDDHKLIEKDVDYFGIFLFLMNITGITTLDPQA
jgi:hypothetical protein